MGDGGGGSREDITISPIGLIRSCYTEKFGIPRQPGLVPSATARLELLPPFGREELVRGLEQFSHIWVHFRFHQTVSEGWKPTVRPPWLGGRKRVGVFATRSPHRPNHLGLSVVRLEAVICSKGQVCLDLSGGDFLDETPVFDVKPYIPYSDCLESASCGYTRDERPAVPVVFSDRAELFCTTYQQNSGRNLHRLIEETVRNDPRPASQKTHKGDFGMMLWDINVRWKVEKEFFFIEYCEKA